MRNLECILLFTQDISIGDWTTPEIHMSFIHSAARLCVIHSAAGLSVIHVVAGLSVFSSAQQD